jgi:AsmA protein
MKTLLRLVLGLSALVLILILAAGVALITLDPNDHKEWISNEVQENTGRNLQLGGDIKLTFYPWLGLEAADVTLGNAEGFGREPFLHTDYVNVRLKLLPLLQNRYEVDTIKVSGAVINLAKNDAGVTNWDDLAGSRQKEQKDQKPLPLSAVVVGGVDIRDISLVWEDAGAGTRYEIKDFAMSTGALVYGAPVDLEMRFTAGANQPEISTDAALTGTIAYTPNRDQVVITPLQLDAVIRSRQIPGGETRMTFATAVQVDMRENTATVSELDLEVLGTRVTGQIQARNIDRAAPSLTAAMDVNGSDLSLFFKVLEIEPLATQLAALDDRKFLMKLDLDADIQRGDIDLSDFSVDMLGANIKGEVKAANVRSSKGAFKGSIEASGPDLPTLLQVAGQFAGGRESKLGNFAARLTTMKRQQKAFSTLVRFDGDLNSGNIDIPALSVAALGINIAGVLNARNMQDGQGTVTGNLSVIGQDLPPLLVAAEQEGLANVLQSFIFEAGINGSRSNLLLQPLSVKALFAGERIPGSPVNLSLNADTRLDLDDESMEVREFLVRGLGLNVSGRINAGHILQAADFNGELKVETFDLRQLMTQLEQELPVMADAQTLKQVALQSSFAGSDNNLALEQLQLSLDDTRLDGNLSVTDFNAPAIRFGVNIDTINLDRYLPPPQEQTAAASPADTAGTPLPVEQLRNLNANGELRIGELILAKARLQDLSLKLDAKDGVLKLDPATANLYQGSFNGDVNLNSTGNIPRLAMNTSLTGIQVEPLLADVMGDGKVRGEGNFSAALIAAGADTGTMKETLSGQMSFRFMNGAIKGYNLGKIMRMGNQLQNNFTLKVSDQEETDFTEISGNPVATNGVIRLDDLSGKSPALRLSGTGVLSNLPESTMDYKITAQLVATSTGQRGKDLQEGKLEGVPLDCYLRGPMDSPKRECDATKLIAALGMKVIEGLIKLPGRALPEDTRTDPASTDQEQAPEQQPLADPGQQVDETLKKAQDALKGLFGR